MELQNVETQYIVSVRIRKRDWINGTFARMIDTCWVLGGQKTFDPQIQWIMDWSNRVKVQFVFPTGETAYTFHTWIKNGCK